MAATQHSSLDFDIESAESSHCHVSLSLRRNKNNQNVDRRSAHGLECGCIALVPILRPYRFV
jgi:hypothetical protein